MKSLMMLSERDIEEMSTSLLQEGIELRSDKDILTEILKEDYENVIVTSNYTASYGTANVKKALSVLRALTSSKLIYLCVSSEEIKDDITKWFYNEGIENIYTIDWRTFDLSRYQKIISVNNLSEPTKVKEELISELDLAFLKTNLESLVKEDFPIFMENNRGRLIDTAQQFITTIRENAELKKKTLELEDINEALLDSKRKTDIINANLTTSLKRKTKSFNELRVNSLKYKNSIEEYNKSIINNGFVQTPITKLNDLAPVVLYFKEFEDVGFYNFYESIRYTLREINKVYVKSIILEKQSREFFDQYTSNGYSIISDTPSTNTIIRDDKMVRYGNPSMLLQTIARPEFKVEVIMIYDKTGTEDLLVEAKRLIPFYIGSYTYKVKTLDIPHQSWISPIEGDWKSIAPLMDRRVFNEDEELIYNAHASNHPLVRYMTDLLFKS